MHNNSLQGCQLEVFFIDTHDVSRLQALFETWNCTAQKLASDVPACSYILLGIELWYVHHAQARTSSCFLSFFPFQYLFYNVPGDFAQLSHMKLQFGINFQILTIAACIILDILLVVTSNKELFYLQLTNVYYKTVHIQL